MSLEKVIAGDGFVRSSSSSSGSGIGGTTGTTDNAILRADGTGGSTLQGSLVTIGDDGSMDAGTIFAVNFITKTGGAILAGTNTARLNDIGVFIASNGTFAFCDSGSNSTPDAILLRDAANTLALRNGANGQTWIVSRAFTDPSNYSQFKTVVTGSVVAFTISELGTGVGTLTGYTFDKAALAPNIPVVDTGWTANADGGDKTAVIGSTATLDGIATALNLVTAGAGTQLENIAQKVKAIEAVLVALKLPNA